MIRIAKKLSPIFVLALSACGGDNSPFDAGATGCTYDGVEYAEGDTFDDSDGCNTCSCQDGEVACTTMACPTACTYDGETYAEGDTFPDTDGCNTCSCEGGLVACSERACAATCTYDGETYVEGDTFPDTDGCNTCGCSAGQVECTLLECSGTIACGGELGDTCADDEYCAYVDTGDMCGAADATAQCEARPEACPELFAPVCGCDGVTYENQCLAAAAGTGVMTEGACTSGGTCTYDGVSYSEGDSFDATDGCNTCSCDSDGNVLCTEMACTSGCTYDGVSYAEGDSFDATDGCNTCSCSSDGRVFCTEMACPSGCIYDGVSYSEGDSFDATDGCNSCYCENSEAVCTLMECSSSCGGMMGATCAGDEYCAYTIGESCGAADATSTCEPRPSACTEEESPVCGCDGNTYSNECFAAAAGTGVMSEGACAESEANCSVGAIEVPSGATVDAGDGCNTCNCSDGVLSCTHVVCTDPQGCGGDGTGSCADDEYCAYTAGEGMCGYADEPSICLKRPSACVATVTSVCGCDGTTYDNPCEAALAGVGVLEDGACQ